MRRVVPFALCLTFLFGPGEADGHVLPKPMAERVTKQYVKADLAVSYVAVFKCPRKSDHVVICHFGVKDASGRVVCRGGQLKLSYPNDSRELEFHFVKAHRFHCADHGGGGSGSGNPLAERRDHVTISLFRGPQTYDNTTVLVALGGEMAAYGGWLVSLYPDDIWTSSDEPLDTSCSVIKRWYKVDCEVAVWSEEYEWCTFRIHFNQNNNAWRAEEIGQYWCSSPELEPPIPMGGVAPRAAARSKAD